MCATGAAAQRVQPGVVGSERQGASEQGAHAARPGEQAVQAGPLRGGHGEVQGGHRLPQEHPEQGKMLALSVRSLCSIWSLPCADGPCSGLPPPPRPQTYGGWLIRTG